MYLKYLLISKWFNKNNNMIGTNQNNLLFSDNLGQK